MHIFSHMRDLCEHKGNLCEKSLCFLCNCVIVEAQMPVKIYGLPRPVKNRAVYVQRKRLKNSSIAFVLEISTRTMFLAVIDQALKRLVRLLRRTEQN